MAGRSVVMSAAYFLLQLIHFVREKFHRTAAFRANHVVMAAAVVLVLVTGDAIVESDFAGQAALGQQLESAIDGGVANSRIFLLHQAVQFVRRKVVASFQERAEDGIPLRRLLQADFLEVPVKNFLGLAHHLARDGRLVINALLQHEVSG